MQVVDYVVNTAHWLWVLALSEEGMKILGLVGLVATLIGTYYGWRGFYKKPQQSSDVKPAEPSLAISTVYSLLKDTNEYQVIANIQNAGNDVVTIREVLLTGQYQEPSGKHVAYIGDQDFLASSRKQITGQPVLGVLDMVSPEIKLTNFAKDTAAARVKYRVEVVARIGNGEERKFVSRYETHYLV